MNIAIVMLAAGRSLRFKKSKRDHKLLHTLNKQTLLKNSLQALKHFNKKDIWIVLGDQKDKIDATLQDYQTTYNPDFKLGMGQSIATGIQAITSGHKQYHAALITLADQIALSADDFHALQKKFNTVYSIENRQQNVVAAEFYSAEQTNKKNFGPPVIFPQYYFSYLQQLKGYKGAKALLHTLDAQKKLTKVHLNNAQVDIDTRKDLANYLTKSRPVQKCNV